MEEMKRPKKKWQMNFGISQSYISRLEKKIIKKMKKEIMSKTRITKCGFLSNDLYKSSELKTHTGRLLVSRSFGKIS